MNISLHKALGMLLEAKRELRSLYLDDPDNEFRAANSTVPVIFRCLCHLLEAAQGHLLNGQDEIERSLMKEQATAMTPTHEPCWKCGSPLYFLSPNVSGWEFYCSKCEHLTSTHAQMEEAQRTKPKGAVGIVCAIPCRITLPT